MNRDNQLPLEEDITVTEEYWQEQHMRRVANLFVYPAGLAYIAVCLLLLFGPDNAPDVIGAVCTEECGGATVFGIRIEWFGGGAMALLLALRLAAQRSLYEPLVAAVVSLALIHGSASLVLAGSQWFGFSSFCSLCQVAAGLSILIASFHFPVATRAFRFPLVTGAQSVALGVFVVLAAWPLFYDGYGDIMEMERKIVVPEIPGEGEMVMANRGEETTDRQVTPDEPVATPAPREEQVTIGPAPPGQVPESLDEAMNILSIGRDDAPWTLFVLSQMGCPVCRRFETQTLPELIREAVEPGHLRVQFLYTSQGRDARFQSIQLIAAMALAGGGEAVTSAITHVQSQDNRTPTVPFLIQSHRDETLKEKADDFLRRTESRLGWNAIANEHHRRSVHLRRVYLEGSTSTPCTVLMRGPVDWADLPPSFNAYSFVGFQIKDPYLEFMGLEGR